LEAEVRAASFQAKYEACVRQLREARTTARRAILRRQVQALDALVGPSPVGKRSLGQGSLDETDPED